MDEQEGREQLCRALDLRSMVHAHRVIVECAQKKDVARLLKIGLDARTLTKLGYYSEHLRLLGYTNSQLAELGFRVPGALVEARSPELSAKDAQKLRQMVQEGCPASELKEKGYGVHLCRKEGFSAGGLMRLGFSSAELAREYSATELRLAGFGIRELLSYFDARALREAGFTATDFRNAGFGIEELRRMGFEDNLITSARYSNIERMKTGLPKRVIDKKL